VVNTYNVCTGRQTGTASAKTQVNPFFTSPPIDFVLAFKFSLERLNHSPAAGNRMPKRSKSAGETRSGNRAQRQCTKNGVVAVFNERKTGTASV